MLKIIVPLAGSSEMFEKAGYSYPKPLIEINGRLMIEHMLDRPAALGIPYQFVFIIKEEDSSKYHLENTLKLLHPGSLIVKLKKNTKGALCSILMTIDSISKDDEILVLNSDQIIDVDFNEIYNYWKDSKAAAGLVTFKSVHPRWSYARIENGEVVQTAEKNPISNHAIAGYYYFSNAGDFFNGAFRVIRNDVNVNGMYFTSPVMNEFILMNKKVLAYEVKQELYHSFYSPQMLAEYERKHLV